MPGSNPARWRPHHPADGLILDMEDAVAPDARNRARANPRALKAAATAGAKPSSASPPRHAVRADLPPPPGADAILLPKVATPT